MNDQAARNFTRRIEDFVCGHCQTKVIGNGYTNHCPECLYSQHVDVMPGDRQATCRGLMAPVHVEAFGAGYKILHRCVQCGHEKKNQSVERDNFDALLAIINTETKTNNRI
jgi:hypothetical protein